MLGLHGGLGEALRIGLGEVFTMAGIGVGMGFVTVGLAGLGEEDQRSGIGGLEAESEVQKDEGIDIEVCETEDVQGDPHQHDDGLPDEEYGRSEKPGEGLRLQGEPVISKDGGQMEMRAVKSQMVGRLFVGVRSRRF